MIDINVDLLQWFIIFLIKNFQWSSSKENMYNKDLAKKLQKPITRKFLKRKVHSPFIDNIWGADLADMQLISKLNKGIRFLLCAIDVFSKYVWVVTLKGAKYITITNAFQILLKGSTHKPNKIWVDKGSKFWNNSVKSWLEKNYIEMY